MKTTEYATSNNPTAITPEEYFDPEFDLKGRDIGRPKEITIRTQKWEIKLQLFPVCQSSNLWKLYFTNIQYSFTLLAMLIKRRLEVISRGLILSSSAVTFQTPDPSLLQGVTKLLWFISSLTKSVLWFLKAVTIALCVKQVEVLCISLFQFPDLYA